MRKMSVVCVVALCAVANAETYYVAKSGTTTPDATRTFETLEAAYAAATGENDIIEIYEGTYDRDITKPLIIDRAIEIRSKDNDPSKVHFVGKNSQSQITDCAFKLTNEGATLKGITIRKITHGKYLLGHSAALNISAGTVDHCVISNISIGNTGCGVGVTGGIIKNSIVAFNSSTYAGRDRKGAGIHLTGAGIVDNCDLFGNSSWGGSGVLISADGASVRNCRIYDNKSDNGNPLKTSGINTDHRGAGIYMEKNGLVENCIISNNLAFIGGGIYATAGTIRNCLISGNKTYLGNGSGLYLDGNNVSLSGTTIIDNTCIFSSTVNQLYMKNSKAENIVVVAKETDTVNSVIMEGTASITYSALPVAVVGEGNIISKRDDFNDEGYPYSASFTMGAYPYNADKVEGVAIAASQSYGTAPLEVTFSHRGSTPVSDCVWRIDGGSPSSGDKFTHTFNDYGNFEVTLSANNGAYTAKKIISVLPKTTYVSDETGNDEANFPYDDPNAPAKTIQAAIDAVYATENEQGTVVIADGTYSYTDSADLSGGYSPMIFINRNLKVKALSSRMVTVNANKKKQGALLTHSKAVLEGVVIENGRYGSNGYGSAGGLTLIYGYVTNCVFRNSYGPYCGTSIALEGEIVDSVISGGTLTRGGPDRMAAGINIFGATTVRDSVITENEGNYGAGIYLNSSSAVVTNCVISKNTIIKDGANGGGGVVNNGGLLVSCIIVSNTANKASGGVHMSHDAAKLRNCLVAFNTAKGTSDLGKQNGGGGGGVMLLKGTIENCTIAQNSSLLSPAGIYQNGGSIVNTISYGNGNNNDDYVKGTSGTVTYSCFSSEVTGEGNIAKNPNFANPEGMDFSLLFGSPAIDAGLILTDFITDINGNERQIGETYDMGAYEMDYSGFFMCSFEVDNNFGVGSVEATLTATATGGSGKYEKYIWNFNDGTDPIETTEPTITRTFGLGSATVTLTVVDSNGKEATTTHYDVVRVETTVTYASPKGRNIKPYDTWEKAATHIQDAIDAVYTSDEITGVVYVADGDYGARDADQYAVSVVSPIRVLGTNSQCKAVVNVRPTNNGNRRALNVNHPKAFIANLTFTNAYETFAGNAVAGGVWLYDGIVSNCVISKCHAPGTGGMVMFGGLFTDGKIMDNYCDTLVSYDRYGGGAYLSGGTLQNTLICGNWQGSAGAVCVNGDTAVMRNCVISNNWSITEGNVKILNGLVERCFITGNRMRNNPSNEALQTGYGVYLEGAKAKLQNSIVVNNYTETANSSGVAAGIRINGAGTLVNVTSFDNRSVDVEGITESDISNNGGTIVNTIAGSLESSNNGTEHHNFVGGDPKFKKVAGTPYSLKANSPCLNQGDDTFWKDSANPVDFLGNNRRKGIVDIGAVERQEDLGLSIILR